MKDAATGWLSANKLKVGVAAAAGLFVGKKLYDGPVFNEQVDLTGETVVVCGNTLLSPQHISISW